MVDWNNFEMACKVILNTIEERASPFNKGRDLREGVKRTPERMKNAFKFLTSGYDDDPNKYLEVVFDEKVYDIVLIDNIDFFSLCEHHLLPFWGKCHIAYIPKGRIVGISKLARLMECYARRLQIQERLCNQIVDALQQYLKPKGSACICECQHFCMTCRGIQKQNSVMVTSALRGIFLTSIQL